MGRRLLGSFSGLAVVPLLAAAPALGDPPDETIRMARKRFQEGVAAIDAGNYEAARVAFQQAYALKPHASVLRNLGQAELKTNRYLEAARHLSTFVRETTYGTAAERDAAAKSLALAETHVGRVLVTVDVPGAEITVDGEPAGRSPFSEPFYAEPGDRLVRIQKDGYEPYEKSQAIEPGRTTQLKIALTASPVPTPAASVSRVASPIETPSGEANANATDGVGPPPPGLVPEPDSAVDGRTVALVASGGVALVSAGVWLGFALKGDSLESRADDLRWQIATLPAGAGCPGRAVCDELRDVSDRRATANTVALVGGIATGVSAAAFAGTLLFWPRSRSGVAGPVLVPALSFDRVGFGVRGAF